MPLRLYAPNPPLASSVECFWYAWGHDGSHATERVLPTGAMQLVVNLREDSVVVGKTAQSRPRTGLSGSVLNGVYTRPLVLDAASREATVGVSFRPGGAAPFLRRSASELRNRTVSLETIWGQAGRRLRQRLLDAPTPRATFRILDATLRDRLETDSGTPSFVHDAIASIRGQSGNASVRALVERTGYSHRHVIDRFRGSVGLTPKQLCRLVRFQAALSHLRNLTVVDWPQVALACGYYDQSHLIRDFKAFADMTPSAYRNSAPDERNHVPVSD